jgi:hypothetical protein
VVDDTGREYRVDAGSDYYWIAPDGTILGTQTDAIPTVDFERLFELS